MKISTYSFINKSYDCYTVHEDMDKFKPVRYSQEVILTIDQSSSSTGLVIGTPGGTKLSVMQLERNKFESGDMASSIYGLVFGRCLYNLLTNLNVKKIYMEERLEGNGFTTNEVLAYIKRKIFECVVDIQISQNRRIELETIDNTEWKKFAIPKEFHCKGKFSEPYYKNKYPELIRFKDDVTDALGIYEFVVGNKFSSEKFQSSLILGESKFNCLNFELLDLNENYTNDLEYVIKSYGYKKITMSSETGDIIDICTRLMKRQKTVYGIVVEKDSILFNQLVQLLNINTYVNRTKILYVYP